MQAFVAMPFNPKFLPVWKAIKEACKNNNIEPCRVDQLPQLDDIHKIIFEEIARSELVIVDFSGDKMITVPNPNVVSEAMYARTQKKPLVILSQNAEALPFDWKTHRAVIYEDNADGLAYLAEVLTENLAGMKKRMAEPGGIWQAFLKKQPVEEKWIETSSNGRYRKSKACVILDAKTDLEWLVGPDQDATWDDAKSWMDSLNVDSGGWRMPTIEELQRLYENGKGSRNIDPIFRTSGYWVWSDDKIGNDSFCVFSFSIGDKVVCPRSHSSNYRAFAVRTKKK